MHFRVPYNRPTVGLKTFERRKLLMACLLMRQPRILLMDEPAAGLINAEIDEIDGRIDADLQIGPDLAKVLEARHQPFGGEHRRDGDGQDMLGPAFRG